MASLEFPNKAPSGNILLTRYQGLSGKIWDWGGLGRLVGPAPLLSGVMVNLQM